MPKIPAIPDQKIGGLSVDKKRRNRHNNKYHPHLYFHENYLNETQF